MAPASWEEPTTSPIPVRCPFFSTCIGSVEPGGQCLNGSAGALCGVCSSRFYRSDRTCLPCPHTGGSIALTIVLIVLGVAALLVLVYLYVRSTVRVPVSSTQRPPIAAVRRFRLLLARLPLRQVATTFKILLSYCQMLFIFSLLESVHWPALFTRFIRDINITLVVGVEAWLSRLFLPVSCAYGELSAYEWLVLTILLPVVCSSVTITLGVAARAAARRSGATRPLAPALYTIHIWFLLLLYPSLSRTNLATYECRRLGGVDYLSSDTRQICYDGTWTAFAVVSAIGVLVYSIGAPVASYALTRSWHTANSDRRRHLGRRLALLLSSYNDDCWWFEAADLIRKLLLTSVILLVFPGTRVQLLFGMIVSMASVITTIKLVPYRDRLCQSLQAVAMLQITFNYMTANVFYVEPGAAVPSSSATNGFLGPLLVIINCVAFALLGVTLMRGAHSTLTMQEAQWADGSAISLASPSSGQYHCFISHQWGSGQVRS